MSKKMPNQFTIRFKNTVDPRIIEFANLQDNFSDTILYLIEKEIGENGIRNLQTVIPPVRSIEGFNRAGQATTYNYVPPTSQIVAQPTSNPVTPIKDHYEVPNPVNLSVAMPENKVVEPSTTGTALPNTKTTEVQAATPLIHSDEESNIEVPSEYED